MIIFGGHGKIALHLARILSDRGYRVTSVFRNPDHAAEKHDGPPGQDKDKDKTPGPPDHAGGPHDGPPGHDEVPGVGNQRKVEEAGPANAPRKDDKKKDDKKDNKKKDDKKK